MNQKVVNFIFLEITQCVIKINFKVLAFNYEKVSITGAGGFIGSYLTKSFLSLGWRVVAIDNFVRGLPRRLPKNNELLTIKKIDIRHDIVELQKSIRNSDIIFHLAAINGTENFIITLI